MANTPVAILDDTMTSIANAIRSKTGGSALMTPGQMPAQIASIPSGGGVGIPREVSAQGIYQSPKTNFSAFSLPATASTVGSYALAYAFYNSSQVAYNSPPIVTADLSSINEIDNSGLYYTFFGCYYLETLNLSSLTRISSSGMQGCCRFCASLVNVNMNKLYQCFDSSLRNAFVHCESLQSISFPVLVTVSDGYVFAAAFQSCANLTSPSFPALKTVSGSYVFQDAFSYCPQLNTNPFPNLEVISGSYAMSSAFRECTSLQSISFQHLSSITGNWAMKEAFNGCTALTSVSFPALTTSSFGSYTSQFGDMLKGCSGVTVHFPASIQSTIGSWSSVTSGFGGTNTTVLFDL